MRRDEGVRVATSRLSGLGLFAARHFEPGERICPYRGIIRRGPFDADLHGDASYIYQWEDGAGRPLFVDGLDDPSPGMYANDAQGPTRRRRCRNNAAFEDDHWRRDGVWLVADREIRNGDEIFVPYGAAYWDMNDDEYEHRV